MASEMTVTQHICEGLLRFILAEDSVTVDVEVMTLKGLYILRQDKHSNKKTLFLGAGTISLPPHSLRGLGKLKANLQKTF